MPIPRKLPSGHNRPSHAGILRSVAGDKGAMAVVLREVAHHDWGWFSREDERMHLQTVDEDARTGPRRVKVWLEDRGKRTCELATGRLSATDLKKLRTKIDAHRSNIEARWINFMIDVGWLDVELQGSIARLTAYPRSHNRYVRDLDLRAAFPGAYSGPRSWDACPPSVDLDSEHALLAVGVQPGLDDRHHLDLTKIIFQD